MTTIASQITSLTVVYSVVYSGADQRKHQSSASLAFVWVIHRDRWIPRTKGQLRGKCFHLMTSSWHLVQWGGWGPGAPSMSVHYVIKRRDNLMLWHVYLNILMCLPRRWYITVSLWVISPTVRLLTIRQHMMNCLIYQIQTQFCWLD